MSEQTSSSAARSFWHSLTDVPTRREMLLFGLVFVALLFALDGMRPRTIVEVPIDATRVDSPLGWTNAMPDPDKQ